MQSNRQAIKQASIRKAFGRSHALEGLVCLGVLSILTAGVFIADLAWKLKHTKFESK